MRKETPYRAQVIKRLKEMFPGCEILINDPSQRQGICDVIVLFEDKWGMLEFKRSKNAARRPNQEYYVNKFAQMSFAAFIYPEVEEEVLRDLQRAFDSR